MQEYLDRLPIIVRASHRRAISMMIGSAIFVAIGAFLLVQGESVIICLLCIGICGLCGAVGLGMIIAPQRLEIGPSGIVQTVLGRTRQFAWADVHNFRPVIVGVKDKTIGFDYVAPSSSRTGLRALNTAIAGVQVTLQPGWQMAPQALANLLNDAREHWLVVEKAAPQTLTGIAGEPSPFMAQHDDVPPPWVVHPGFGVGDGFWRQTGEAWLAGVWQPFWAALSVEQQNAYLVRWHAPQEWIDFYSPDSEYRQWLNSVDDDVEDKDNTRDHSQ